jgi:hypothetical protein
VFARVETFALYRRDRDIAFFDANKSRLSAAIETRPAPIISCMMYCVQIGAFCFKEEVARRETRAAPQTPADLYAFPCFINAALFSCFPPPPVGFAR